MVRDSWKSPIWAALVAFLWTGLLPVMAAAQNEDDAAEGAADSARDSEKQPAADIYAVPDGTPAELIAFIQNLLSTPPADQSQEGLQLHRDKIIESSVAAASKVIAAEEATPEEVATAAELKLLVLSSAARLGIEGMQTQLDDFKESLRKDERSLVRAVIVQRDILDQTAQWHQLDDEGKQKYLDDFVGFLKSIELEPRHGQLVRVAAQMIGQQDPKAAEELIGGTIPVFAASENEVVAAIPLRLLGFVRNMNLVGSLMPVEGRLLDGADFDWSAYKDKVVLVDFWATWCGPCIAELPNVVDNYKRFHGKGFEVVGISLDTDLLKVRDFVEQREIPWQILFSEDPNATGWEHPMAVTYGIEAIPAAILVGKDGKVITKEARGEELGSRLRELLGEPLPIADDAADEAVTASQSTPDEGKE
jgi:thiol-disulfide isomerase/thioredoxin